MQDQETDTYWSIMNGEAIGGKMRGTKLAELPVGEKMQWRDWYKKHPETVVLSVDGEEDVEKNHYDNYFNSGDGFRKLQAQDKRLKTKEPIFAFQFKDRKIAIPHAAFFGGKIFDLGDASLFLFRQKSDAIFASTRAFLTDKNSLKQIDGLWMDSKTGCRFDRNTGKFTGATNNCPQTFNGFDTFWYTWSLINKDTEVLGSKK